AVYGAFHLASARFNRRQRIRNRQPKVVVAVDRDRNVFHSLDALAQRPNDVRVFARDGVTNRVRYVDGTSAGLYGYGNTLAEEIEIGSSGVFRRKLHIGCQAPREAHSAFDVFERLLAS